MKHSIISRDPLVGTLAAIIGLVLITEWLHGEPRWMAQIYHLMPPMSNLEQKVVYPGTPEFATA
jgi:hypothetical protein